MMINWLDAVSLIVVFTYDMSREKDAEALFRFIREQSGAFDKIIIRGLYSRKDLKPVEWYRNERGEIVIEVQESK